MAKIRVLLVHNRLSWHPITWFSFIIRVFTSSRWNHNALEVTTSDGVFILESISQGVKYTPYTEWVKHGHRIVLPLTVPSPEVDLPRLQQLVGQPYGFKDIMRIILFLIRNRWLGQDYSWQNVGYQNDGYICSEIVAELLGLDLNVLYVPGDFEHLPQLIKEKEFRT